MPLGRHLGYRIVLHELCRAGEADTRRDLLERLGTMLKLEGADRAALEAREIEECEGKVPRAFDARRAFRAACRAALSDGGLNEREVRILNRLAACLQLDRAEKKAIVAAVKAELAPGAGAEAAPASGKAELLVDQRFLVSSEELPDDPEDSNDDAAFAKLIFERPTGEILAVKLDEVQSKLQPPSLKSPRGVQAESPFPRAEAGRPKAPAAATVTVEPAPARARASRATPDLAPTRASPQLAPPARPRSRVLPAAMLVALLAAGLGGVWFWFARDSADTESPATANRRPPRPTTAAQTRPPPPKAPRPSFDRLPRPAPWQSPPGGSPSPLLALAQASSLRMRRAELGTLLTSSLSLAPSAGLRPSFFVRLVSLGLQDAQVKQALTRIAGASSDPLRLEAMVALGRMREATLQPTFDRLASSSHPVERGVGLLGLSRLDGDRRRWEQETGPADRCWQMGRFLALAGDPESVPLLVRCLRDDDANRRQESLGLLARGPGGMASPLGTAFAVDAVLETLADSDPSVRLAALDCLSQIGDRSCIPFVIRALASPRATERALGAKTLGILGDSEAVVPLLGGLGDAEAAVREQAGLALAFLDGLPLQFLAGRLKTMQKGTEARLSLAGALLRPEHRQVLEVLWPLLPLLERRERQMALDLLTRLADFPSTRARALTGLRTAAQTASGDLAEMLAEATNRVTAAATQKLDRAPALEQQLDAGAAASPPGQAPPSGSSPESQLEAAQMLAVARGRESLERLARLACHPNGAVRRRVLALTGALASKEDRPFLRELFLQATPGEQSILAEHLARLEDPTPASYFANQLATAAGDGVESRAQRRLAAWGLARLGVLEAARPLHEALKDSSWPVRALAAWGLTRLTVLGALGPAEADLVRVRLAEILRDRRLEVQWAATPR
jgi:HEAT repeat protein